MPSSARPPIKLDEVARVLGLADADGLLCHLAGAGRTIATHWIKRCARRSDARPDRRPSSRGR